MKVPKFTQEIESEFFGRIVDDFSINPVVNISEEIIPANDLNPNIKNKYKSKVTVIFEQVVDKNVNYDLLKEQARIGINRYVYNEVINELYTIENEIMKGCSREKVIEKIEKMIKTLSQ